MEPIKFIIDPKEIIFVGYPLMKTLLASSITIKEIQYPIWNKNGCQIKRKIHHVVAAYIKNLIINPEWAIIKIIAFIPVWLISGTKYWYKFKPYKIQKPPPFCKICNDKGKYFIPDFIKGKKGKWAICTNCSENQGEQFVLKYKCICCLDTGNIGPKRKCPHCEKRVEQIIKDT